MKLRPHYHYARIQRTEDGVKVFKLSVGKGGGNDVSLETRLEGKFLEISGYADADGGAELCSAISSLLPHPSPEYGNEEARYYWDVPAALLRDTTLEAERLLEKAIELDRDGKYFVSAWEPQAIKDFLENPKPWF